MLDITNSAEAKAIDEYMINTLQIPELVLMEQAAMAVSRKIMENIPCGDRVLCVAGSGKNGGDALAVGRILLMYGYDVYIGVLSNDLPEDVKKNLLFFLHTDRLTLLTTDSLDNFFSKHASAIVDGLFGIGLHRPVEGICAEIIDRINAQQGAKIFSIDIPSGIFADTGIGGKAVFADETVTFGYAKPGHLLFPGRKHTGRLTISTVGIDDGRMPLNTKWVDTCSLPRREQDTHKGNYGKLAVMAGSKGMAGAAILSLKAAIAGGTGLTTLLSCSYVCDAAQNTVFPATARCISSEADYISCSEPFYHFFDGYSAIAAGPGLGRNKDTLSIVTALLRSDIPKVIDADALNLLSEDLPVFGQNTVLTPHIGEFSRLSGLLPTQIIADRLTCARKFAIKYKVVLLLKGATTIVTDGITAYLVTAGTPAMAKGGSGDVLTGVVGALLAQGMPAIEAAYTAAFFCGKAAEMAVLNKGEYAFTPEDTIAHLSSVLG